MRRKHGTHCRTSIREQSSDVKRYDCVQNKGGGAYPTSDYGLNGLHLKVLVILD